MQVRQLNIDIVNSKVEFEENISNFIVIIFLVFIILSSFLILNKRSQSLLHLLFKAYVSKHIVCSKQGL